MHMKNKLIHVLLKNSPEWSLEMAKRIKKSFRNQKLAEQQKKGGFSKEDLIAWYWNGTSLSWFAKFDLQ